MRYDAWTTVGIITHCYDDYNSAAAANGGEPRYWRGRVGRQTLDALDWNSIKSSVNGAERGISEYRTHAEVVEVVVVMCIETETLIKYI